MQIMTVGELKANFSKVVDEISKGKSVAFSYGKKRKPIGIVSAYKEPKRKKIKLGIWEGKASFKIKEGFKMTEDEFLNS